MTMTNLRNGIINKKALAFAILLAGLFISLSIIQVQAAANDSSITLKKDPGTGLFVLTIKDPDGIQEFSLAPASGSSYGGGLSGCPTTFSINNVSFADPSDFQPVMPAYVTDCHNNTASLEIAPPKEGLAKSKSVVKEEAPPPAPAPTETPKEENKGGPLSASDVIYPVKELGGCQSEAECRSYCDNSQNAKECFTFAKKYNLITGKELEDAKDHFLSVNNGPGGCSSGASCETYCNNTDHLDECISFAEKNGYYSGDELAQAKKYQEILKTGKPFPGGCKDRNSCEIYCNDADHMEECLNFAEDTGFMPKDEIAQARKILPLMKRGETPGGCASREQCDKYCADDSHSEECVAFAEKAGLISSEDAAMIKKTGGRGPGGCHSKQQCEAYCETNSDECFRWAQDNGLVSADDLAKMKTGLSRFREQLDKIPPEVTQCLKDAVGEKNFEKLSNGEPVFDRSLEGKMKSCFGQITAQCSKQLNTLPPEAAQCIKDVVGEEGFKKLQSGEPDENVDFSSLEGCFQQLQSSFGGQQGGPGGGPGGPGGGFSGPGGCKSIDECTSYCQEHQEECQNFAPPGGASGGGRPTGGNFPGSSGSGGEQHNGFTECGIVDGAVADYVCGTGGSSRGAPTGEGAETTYFNECHAKQQGAQIAHRGVCVRAGGPDKPCSDIAHPVCGTDGNSWTSECHAKEAGASVKHDGVCINEDFYQKPPISPQNYPTSPEDYCKQNPYKCGGPENYQAPSGGSSVPPPGNFSGPGGCTTPEACQSYCTEHYTDPACGGGGQRYP